MVRQIMPTEDTHKDPCEENLHLLHGMIAAEHTVLTEARSEQGELDRIKSREISLLEVSEVVLSELNVYRTNHKLKACIFTAQYSIAHINCFRVFVTPNDRYINACSFRFDKGQNHEVLCKATREQTRAAEDAREKLRHHGGRLHKARQIPEHGRATVTDGEGTCVNLFVCPSDITSFKSDYCINYHRPFVHE